MTERIYYFVYANRKDNPRDEECHRISRPVEQQEDAYRIADSIRRRLKFDEGYDYVYMHVDTQGPMTWDAETQRLVHPN